MINHFLKLGGVTSVEEFYRKFPTEAHFDNHVHKMKYGGMYAYDEGGPTDPPYQLDENDRIYNMVNQIAAGANRQPPPEYNNYTVPDAVNTTVTVAKPAVPKVSPYSGVSIVDFLASNNKATDKASRKKLAESLGMTGYTGKAGENNRLLKLLQAKPELLDSYETVISKPLTSVTNKSSAVSKATTPTAKKKQVVVNQPVVNQGYQPTEKELNAYMAEENKRQQLANPYIIDQVANDKRNYTMGNYGVKQDGLGDQNNPAMTTPGYIPFGSQSFLEQIPVNQPQPWGGARPRFQGDMSQPWDREGKQNKKFYDEAFQTFKRQSEQGKKVGVPYSLNSSVAKIYEMALKDWKEQTGMAMGGQPCYNCGGMYDQGGMYPDGRAVVNNYAHGGYYGNVPQHGNPGTYADGTSGTASGGQYFAFGGDLLKGFSEGMRDGSLQGLAGGIANMGANMGMSGGITSPIKNMNDKSGNLKTDLSTYLSSAGANLDPKAIQDIVNKYAAGGAFIPVQTIPGQLPKYGYGKAMYGMGMAYGGDIPDGRALVNSYAEGGMSPEEQAMMAQQQGQQTAPPQEQQPDPQQVMQQVAQMLQQGAQPEQVMQQLVQMGIPQEQAQQIIQQVMQQLQGQQQGPQEEMAEGPQGQEAPQQEAMEGQAMQMYGGGIGRNSKFAVGGEYDVNENDVQKLINQGYKIQYL